LHIIRDSEFVKALDNILDYIAVDSLIASIDFNRELEEVINNISHMPYKYRQSFYYDDENIRDMIFKGYTLPYLIDTKNNCIVLLDIFKWVNK
jgi:plasmid stabilization system protein ParE